MGILMLNIWECHCICREMSACEKDDRCSLTVLTLEAAEPKKVLISSSDTGTGSWLTKSVQGFLFGLPVTGVRAPVLSVGEMRSVRLAEVEGAGDGAKERGRGLVAADADVAVLSSMSALPLSSPFTSFFDNFFLDVLSFPITGLPGAVDPLATPFSLTADSKSWVPLTGLW